MAPFASGMAFGSPLAIRSRKRLWHSAKPGTGISASRARFRRPLDRLGVGAEQRQQKRDFFLRTDLDHDDLLFARLVGGGRRDVRDYLVSALFQACFVATRDHGRLK